MTVQILRGDCRDVLKTLPDESVHCCVTSPPYWGLRDYGTAKWEGGDVGCDHRQFAYPPGQETPGGRKGSMPMSEKVFKEICGKCGARRIDSQLGLEPSFADYIEMMVAVFREVKRVLRKDGTCWINMGDSLAGHNLPGWRPGNEDKNGGVSNKNGVGYVAGLKPKDLIGIPWRLAFALQADGWVLRQEIIWAKSNPMPESVTDRCTKGHEQLFMFAKAKWSGPQPGRFGHISDQDARWLALCIDTEGCIVVKRVKQNDGGADAFGPQVTFGGTSKELIYRFQEIIGHGNIATRPGKNAPMFYWQLGNNIARDFLHRIYPYLIVKQRQARIAIYVDDLVYYRGGKMLSRKQRAPAENEQLLSLWARNKQCNHFGSPDLTDVPEPKFGRWSDCQKYYYDSEAIREPLEEKTYTTFGCLHRPQGNDALGKVKSDNWGKSVTERKPKLNAAGEIAGRNRRTVWEIATAPFNGSHLLADYVGADGIPYKRSEDCPIHGQRDRREIQQTALNGEPLNHQPAHNLGSGIDLASVPFALPDAIPSMTNYKTCEETSPAHDLQNSIESKRLARLQTRPVDGPITVDGFSCHSDDKQALSKPAAYAMDLPRPACVEIAKPHNSENHKTAPAPATSPACTASAQIGESIGDKLELPEFFDLAGHNAENNNGRADLVDHLSAQKPHRNANKLSSKNNKCTCERMSIDHFATFPPKLIEPCILAGCPKDGLVLDPFGGAGTTGLVADRLQRNAILIGLNPAYSGMGMRRI